MKRLIRRRALVLAPLAAGFCFCGAAQAAPLALQIDLFMNGEWVWGADPAAVPDAAGGYTIPDGSYAPGSGAYEFSWNNVHFDTDPFIDLNSVLTNNTGLTQTFTVSVSLPIAPPISPSSLMGGSTGYTLTDSNGNSSALLSTVGPGKSLYTGVIDNADALQLFAHPTTLAIASQGGTDTISTSAGLPGPTLPGPAALASIGIRHEVSLSPGDSVSFTSFFIVEAPEPATLALLLLGGGTLLGRRRR